MHCAHCGRPVTREEYYFIETSQGTFFIRDTCAAEIGYRWPQDGTPLRHHPDFETRPGLGV